MERWVQVLVPILLLIATAASQSDSGIVVKQPSGGPPNIQRLPPEQLAKIQKLANLQKNFGKNMNSPGVVLSLKEIDRTRTADRTLVKYFLYANGLRKNTTYTIFQVQIDGSIIKTLDGVTLGVDGMSICAGRAGTCKGSGPDDPIALVFFAGKGEPKRLALVSDDEAHLKGGVAVIPFPNSTTHNGCRLESVLGTPNGELTFLQGSGFEPDSELLIDSGSYDEKHHDTARAEADGSYFAVAMPNVVGKKSGTDTWEVKAKKCNPKLTFPWGENSYHLE